MKKGVTLFFIPIFIVLGVCRTWRWNCFKTVPSEENLINLYCHLPIRSLTCADVITHATANGLALSQFMSLKHAAF